VTSIGTAAGGAGDDPIVMEVDGDLRHLHASDAALAMVGLPAEALLGRTAREAGLPAEVVVPLETALREAVETGEERQLELEMPTVEGLRWLHLRLVPRRAAAGGPSRVELLASDITARKHAELRLSAGNAAFRALVEDSPDPIALIDARERIVFVNAALARATDREPGSLIGRGVAELGLPPEAASRLERAVVDAFATGARLAIDFSVPSPEGPRWLTGRVLPEPGADRGHVVVSFIDVTERVNREAEQAALRRVATVVAREADLEEIGRVVAQEAAILLDADGSAVYRFRSPTEAAPIAAHPPAAPGAEVPEAVVLSGGSATGRTARSGEPERVDDYGMVVPDDSITEVLEAGLRSGIAAPLWTRGQLWGALAAGSARPHAFNAADERRLAAFAELATIAVSNAETRAELDRLIATDPLTGLANRRAFTARLTGEVERARRHGHMLALAIMDLDDFKVINDTLGHQAGDAVLEEVGRRLLATCRAGELVARIGGEEFAWILPQIDTAGAIRAVERARTAIAGISAEGVAGITCSAGVCDLSVAGDAEELQRHADRALYSAKRAGRNRVQAA
jgi:diguanylate cyclase (GGDEF)-like protein/PAS domain S-box-containing protein